MTCRAWTPECFIPVCACIDQEEPVHFSVFGRWLSFCVRDRSSPTAGHEPDSSANRSAARATEAASADFTKADGEPDLFAMLSLLAPRMTDSDTNCVSQRGQAG